MGTYVFLLLMHMPYLKPDIFFGQRSWRIGYNVFKTLREVSADLTIECQLSSYLQTLVILLLLFVDYPETKVNLVCLFKIRLHPHHL